VAHATLFGYLFFNSHNRYSIEVDDIYIQHFAWGLLGVLSAGCGLLAWMHWSCIDEFVVGFKSVEELYPSPPLGVDSADTSQLPREKNLHVKFQYFQSQPGNSTVTPLYQ
jgi:hypothetical protein